MGKDSRPSPSSSYVGAAFSRDCFASDRVAAESRSYSRSYIELRGESRLGLLGDLAERSDVVHRDVRQRLAVQLDAGLQQAVHEAAVAQAVHAGGGVDAHDPQRTELALALLAA